MSFDFAACPYEFAGKSSDHLGQVCGMRGGIVGGILISRGRQVFFPSWKLLNGWVDRNVIC